MRIVHFLSGLDRGGAQRVVAELTRQMSATHSVEVWLKCRKEVVFGLPKEVACIDLADEECLSTLAVVRKLVSMLRESRPDLLVAHTNRNTAPAIVAARIANVPVYAVEHTVDAALSSPLWRIARRLTYPLAKRVLVLSSDQVRAFGRARTVVMPNPLPETAFPRTEDPDYLTVKTHLDEHGLLRLVYVGRLEHVKGVDRLVEICGELTVPFHLEIVGSGALEQALMEQVTAAGLGERVTFHGWQSELESYYRRASIVVMASRVEGFGLSLIEGMVSGCVPVVYDVPGGFSDIIRDGENGFLVPDGDVTGFAGRLTELFHSEVQWRRLSRSAAETAKQYAPDRIVEHWSNLFKEDGLIPS